MDGFHNFWAAYPRRVNKRDAEKAWKQIQAEQQQAAIMALLADRKINEWRGRRLDKVPYPATFLRGEDFSERAEALTDDPLQGTHWCTLCPHPHQWVSDDPTDFASYELACPEFRSMLKKGK